MLKGSSIGVQKYLSIFGEWRGRQKFIQHGYVLVGPMCTNDVKAVVYVSGSETIAVFFLYILSILHGQERICRVQQSESGKQNEVQPRRSFFLNVIEEKV
jgi:hypothetical protein